MKFLYFFLTMTVLSFISCESEEVNPSHFMGTYEGVFRAEDVQNTLKKSGPVTLILHENGYECIGNPNMVPAGGQGTFVKKDDKLIFKQDGVWQRVNLEMVLQGAYSYSFEGKELELWRETNGKYLKYDLIRK